VKKALLLCAGMLMSLSVWAASSPAVKKTVAQPVHAKTVQAKKAHATKKLAGNFVVQNIEVQGISRISKQTILSDVAVAKGQEITAALSNKTIKLLYQTGYFDNVVLKRQGNTLIIVVSERPTIASVSIKGNQKIKTPILKKVLLKANVVVGDMLDRTVIKRLTQSLEQAYYSQGKYAVKVHLIIAPISRNRVNVKVKISEGLTAEIARIDIVGNAAFSESKLRDQLVLTTPGLISFFTGDDQYTQQKLQKSIDTLQRYYMDRGYIHFRVTSTQASLGPEHKKTYITINLHEGAKYNFSGFKLVGKFVVSKATLAKLVEIKKGDVFSRQTVLDAAKAMTHALGSKGYAFANINPMPNVNEKNKTAEITFYVNPQQRVYVRDINFMGNTVTNDVVLRQRMRYVEGSRFDLGKVNNSKIHLQRLKYLQNITEQTTPVPGTPDLVDTNYKVKERTANSVGMSFGYSQLDKIILGASLGMPNVFGAGNALTIATQLSKPYKSLNFSYTDPYFTMTGVQQTVTAYLTHVNNSLRNLANYSTNSVGTTLGYAIPINNDDFFNIGGGFDHTNLLQPKDDTSMTVQQFVNNNGNGFNTYTLNLGWSRVATNAAYFPTKGSTAKLGTNIAIPGSTLKWYKLYANGTYYIPVSRRTTFAFSSGANFGSGYGGDKNLPFFDNFYGGGWGSVRGFSQGTMGPRDTDCSASSSSGTCPAASETKGQALGGNLSLYASANYYFPVPFAEDQHSFRMGVFLDVGNVYQTYTSDTIYTKDDVKSPRHPTFSNLRYGTGVAFEWISPLGPLDFSLGKALNPKTGDDTQFFQFTLGTVFD
jgi:outer membrane protein insertion porin family